MLVDRRGMRGAELDLTDLVWVAHQLMCEIACELKTLHKANRARIAEPGNDRKFGADYLRMAD